MLGGGVVHLSALLLDHGDTPRVQQAGASTAANIQKRKHPEKCGNRYTSQ